MGYAVGVNNNGRAIGYGVSATCDQEGCEHPIDRGVAYVCGGPDAAGNAGMEDEPYCGDYFCDEHLVSLPARADGEFRGHLMVCTTCYERQTCPTCRGSGHDDEGELCGDCDSHGACAQRDGVMV